MQAHIDLIHRFYSSFQARDAEGMAACYHPNVQFTDPVFGELHGEEAGMMWRMLCARGKDLVLTFSDVTADSQTGSARWEARYTFSQTGRKVHNQIAANFIFQDGLIVQHKDDFDLWRWSRMALGPVGVLLGWTPFLTRKIQANARNGLEAYMKKQG